MVRVTRRPAAALGAITLAALVLRVVYVLGWHDPAPIGGDAYYYHHGANLFADGQGFPQPYWLLQENWDTPGAQHPPLYIVALGLGSLLGFTTYLEHQLLSCLMGAATVAVVGVLGTRLAGARVGLLAAAVAAVYPNLWFNDALVLSETLVQLMSALVLLSAHAFWVRRDTRSAVVLGVVVGLAALTRAELILLSVVLVLPMCVLLRELAVRRRLALLAAAAVAVTATLLPWCAYNLARYERPVLLTSGLDLALLVANCDDTYTGPTKGWWSYRCYLATPRPPGDESEQAVVYREIVRAYVSEHRSELPGVVAARIGRTWGLYAPGGQLVLDTIETRELPASRVGLGMYYVLAVLTPVGLVRLRRRGVPVLPVVSLLVVVTAASALIYGTTRFRASAEPGLVLAAAVALAAPRRRPAAVAGTGTEPLSGTAPESPPTDPRRSGRPDTASTSAGGTPPPAADSAAGPPGSDRTSAP